MQLAHSDAPGDFGMLNLEEMRHEKNPQGSSNKDSAVEEF